MGGEVPEENKIPYRQQVIRALVQRYIESARREFEETKRKGTMPVKKLTLTPPTKPTGLFKGHVRGS